MIKARQEEQVINKTIHLALGLNPRAEKEPPDSGHPVNRAVAQNALRAPTR